MNIDYVLSAHGFGGGSSGNGKDKIPPPPISNFTSSAGDAKVVLNWTNPVDTDFVGLRIQRKIGSSPESLTDGVTVFNGSATTYTDTTAINDEINYYRAFTYDYDNNYNDDSSQVTNATPHQPSNVSGLTLSQNDNGELITINWVNPTESTFELNEVYVSTTNLISLTYEQTKANAILLYSGIDTSATYTTTPNNTYYVKVFSKHTVLDEPYITSGVTDSILTVDTVAPGTITNLSKVENDQYVTLSWTNPTDSDFSKVKIMYKTDTYPADISDGTVAYEGSGTTTTITGLTNDTTYYFRVFAYDTNGNINTTTDNQQITCVPSNVKIYGVKIDTTNSNPETAVTYTDDAIDMTGASTSWDSIYPFNDIRPFLMLNGAEVVELDKNDFTKDINGNSVDIASGSAGDVYIRFPKIYWKLWQEGNYQYVKYATKQVDDTWKSLAHINSRTGNNCDYVYISAYLGYSDGTKIRSISGKSPTVNIALADIRTKAQANGDKYDQIGFYQLMMLQILYLIRYKNLDSQTALGRGYVDGNSAKTNTGGTNSKGMYYGETTGKQQMKFAGIEDFYGNCYYYIDGIKTDASWNVLLGTSNFNNDAKGYTSYSSGLTANVSGYLSAIQGTTEKGFLIKTASGSGTTYYSDYASLNAGFFACFGAYRNIGSTGGAFLLHVGLGGSADSNIAPRLLIFA